MKFFNRLLFICNACSIAAAILRLIEQGQKKETVHTGILEPLPWLQNIIVLLGYSAILLNLIFVIIFFSHLLLRKKLIQPAWVSIFNVALFPIQAWYFFFLK